MAEHTGDPELDELIEEFKHHGECRLGNEADDVWRIPISEFRKPEQAFMYCDAVSVSLVEFLKGRGVERACVHWTEVPVQFSLPHCVVRVEKDGRTYSVDFTAAQVGRQEFPLIELAD
jgi:hypothetical protein